MFNVEEEFIKFFDAQGYTVYADVPNPRPDGDFLTVERTGGQEINVAIDNPTIAVQCWSDSRYNASQLAYEVANVAKQLPHYSTKVTRCKQTSLYNFPYENLARYQVIFDVVTYKE